MFYKLMFNHYWGCVIISKITFDIDEDLLEDLKKQALLRQSSCLDLMVEYICQGIDEQKGIDNMLSVNLNQKVVEKVNIMAKLTDGTPEEVVNDTLWDNLEKIVDIPDELDYDRIWNMLEHDKPEGDDILDNLSRLGQEGWD